MLLTSVIFSFLNYSSLMLLFLNCFFDNDLLIFILHLYYIKTHWIIQLTVLIKLHTSSERFNAIFLTQIKLELRQFLHTHSQTYLAMYSEVVWGERWALHLLVTTWGKVNDKQFKSAFMMLNYYIGHYHVLNHDSPVSHIIQFYNGHTAEHSIWHNIKSLTYS